jgi:hypothetical protein
VNEWAVSVGVVVGDAWGMMEVKIGCDKWKAMKTRVYLIMDEVID